jgi:hypothetical protein
MKDFGYTVMQSTIYMYQYDFNGMWMRTASDSWENYYAMALFLN